MNLNVLYTVNNKYIDIMLVSLTSLVLNNNSYDNINFFVVCSDFNSNDYERIERYVNKFNNVDLLFYPINDFDIKRFNIPDWRGNQIANARLFYQSIINTDKIDKLLYLDADTIVVGDLGDLNNYNHQIMAVRDAGLLSYMKKLGVNKYYNSGVLLFDVESWKNGLFEEKIIKFLREKNNYKFKFPDQDILNLVLSEDISDLSYKYNMGPYFMMENEWLLKFYFNEKFRQIGYLGAKESLTAPKILHSCGFLDIKPWFDNRINPLTDVFLEYMKLVNPDFVMEELSGLKKLFNEYDKLFYLFLIIKPYLPVEVGEVARKLIRNK